MPVVFSFVFSLGVSLGGGGLGASAVCLGFCYMFRLGGLSGTRFSWRC